MVIVLMLIAAFGVVMVAIGTQGQSSVQASGGIRSERLQQYAAAGAMEGAINALRRTTHGRDLPGDTCPDYQQTLDQTEGSGTVAVPVTVRCEVRPGSGIEQPPTSTAPGYALLTTRGLAGYGTGDGIQTSGGNNPLRADGAVYSNSTIKVPKGLEATRVGAFGACTGTITVTEPPVTCGSGAQVLDPGGDAATDPATGPWAADLQSVPPTAPAVTCNTTTKVATMQPGAYYDLGALSSGIGSCAITYMTPGAYYFDFDAGSPSNTQWTIGNALIGGTPKDWSPTAPNAPASLSIPGACHQGDASKLGVQLMFARSSRLAVAGSGQVELCPTVSPSGQQIAVYARKTTQAVTSTPTTVTLAPTGATATPASLATPPANVLALDDTTDQATVSGHDATATATLTGFPTATIPAGSVITSVEIRVRHAETGSVASLAVAATAGGQNLCPTPTSSTLAASAALVTQSVTCTPNLAWTAPVDTQVGFTVKRPGSGNPNQSTTVRLDGVELLVSYAANPVAPLRGETLGTTIISMNPGGGNQGELYVWGTVYAPFGVIDIDFKNNSNTGFGRGAVINAFLGSNVPPAQTLAPFTEPAPATKHDDRNVILRAYVDGRDSPAVVAYVTYRDEGGDDLGRTVDVLSWDSVD
jgi:hypothetical protein